MAGKNPIILFHTEELNFEKVKADGQKEEQIIISGNAQPLNEDSRNGVRYRPESVKKAYKTLEGAAFLNGHDPMKPLGHVESTGLTDTHMTYRVNVDPEEKEYIRKVERGDIRHVSVGCMVENAQWNEEDNLFEVDVKEYVELSAVTVPGFANTSANKEGAVYLANALGDKKALEKLKKITEETDPEDDKKDKDEEEDEEPKDKPKDDKPKDDKPKDEPKDEADDSDKDDTPKDTKKDDEEEEEPEGKDKDKDEPEDDDKKDEEAEPEDKKEPEDKDEEEDEPYDKDKDKEESLKVNTEENDVGQDEEIPVEERVATLEKAMEEVFAKLDEANNRVSILEANVDAMNDSEENTDAKTTEKLDIDTTEEFKDTHNNTQSKENLKAKEKALLGESTKKINSEKNVVDMNKVRMSNLSY